MTPVRSLGRAHSAHAAGPARLPVPHLYLQNGYHIYGDSWREQRYSAG